MVNMKNDNCVVGLISFFIAGFYIGPILENGNFGIKTTDLAGAVATLIAAYVGAHFAFSLSEKKKREDERVKELNNIHLFNSKLYLVINDLLQIEKYYILTTKKFHVNERHIFVQPTDHQDENRYNIEVSDLAFITHPRYFDLYTRIIINIELYKKCLKTLNNRSEFLRTAQSIFSSKELKQGQPCTAKYLISLIDESLNQNIKISTDASIEFGESAINNLFKIKDEVLAILSEKYPNEKFIDYDRPKYNIENKLMPL